MSNFLVTASSSGGESGGEKTQAPLVPTTTSKLTGAIRVGSAGATILANLKVGASEFVGFFGGNAFSVIGAPSIAGGLCAARPWASGGLSKIIPPAFFDGLCRFSGYQVGTITPQAVASTGSTMKTQKKTQQQFMLPTVSGDPEVDIWAEPEAVRLGTRTYIFWNSKGVLDCKVEGPNFFHSTLSGGASTVPLSGATTYTIECTIPGGETVRDSVTVRLAI